MQDKKTESITFRISKQQKQKLEELAKADDRSISYIVSKIIDAHFQKETAPD